MPQPPIKLPALEKHNAPYPTPYYPYDDMYGAHEESASTTLTFLTEGKATPDSVDMLDAEHQIEGASLLKSEVSDMLNTWLDREMKTYIQSIDTRLERLLTLVSSRRHSSWKLTNSLETSRHSGWKLTNSSKSAANGSTSLDELVEPNRTDKADDTLVNQSFDRTIGKTTSSRILSPGKTWRGNRSTSAASLPAPHKTLQTQGTQELRDIIAAYTDERRGCFVNAWRFLENPRSGRWARIYAVVMAASTILSVFFTFWQSAQECPFFRSYANVINIGLEIAFSIEILARFIVSPDHTAFWHNLYNYIDLISSIPLPYRCVAILLSSVGIEHDAEDFLSKVAFVPVLRLFRLMRHFESFQLLLSAFLLALEVLPVLLYTLSIIALVFSALIRIVEPSENIENLPQALWLVIVTMTTVGYGDVTPETALGQVVTTMLMMVSVLYMAIPIGIVGNAFSQVWDARDRLLLMRRMREAFVHHGFNAKTLRGIVAQFDLNKDGVFSLEQFKTLLKAMHINISDERVLLLMDDMDEDGCGSIRLDELMRGLFPRDFREQLDSMVLKDAKRRSTTISFGSSLSPHASIERLATSNAAELTTPNTTQLTTSYTTQLSKSTTAHTSRSTIAQLTHHSRKIGESSPHTPPQSATPRGLNLAAARPTICNSS